MAAMAGGLAKLAGVARAAGLAALFGALLTGATAAAPTVWQDNTTGLAIGGYDPVAYFTDREPRRGQAALEYAWRDAVFRFANVGNLQAFARDPRIYAPRFSGFDPYAASLGIAVEGEPELWAIRGDRLYLFESAHNRDLWAREPDAVLARAERQWPALAVRLPALP